MQITNYMVTHSVLANRAGGFVKLTPRYYFDNIESILPHLVNEDNVFFYYYPFPIKKIKRFVMSIFYKCSLEFYRMNIFPAMNEHDKNTEGLLESVFYRRIQLLKHTALYVDYPHFSGVSGTTGKQIRNQYYLFRKVCSHLGLLAYRIT